MDFDFPGDLEGKLRSSGARFCFSVWPTVRPKVTLGPKPKAESSGHGNMGKQ
jgi:hypothetical protein